MFTKIWAGFIAPWFGLPSRWEESDGTSGSADKGAASNVFTPGQRVRTTVGDGQIISVVKTSDSFRYLMKFSFGVGFVKASAVDHLLPASNSGSEMDTSADDSDYTSQLMQDGVQVLFGTEKVYLFVRLYILLVTMLYQAKDIIDRTDADSSNSMGDEGAAKKSGYSGVMSSLQALIQGKIGGKDFEALCRKIVRKDVHNFVAIPPLVESCSEALVDMAKEDCLDNLYTCSQLKLKDLNQLRNLSLNVSDEAIYRLQIQTSASQVFFSYLPTDVELQLTNPLDVKPPEPAALEDKPSESVAKRPLETEESNEHKTEPETAKDDSVVEPEQKRMKMEEGKPEDTPKTSDVGLTTPVIPLPPS